VPFFLVRNKVDADIEAEVEKAQEYDNDVPELDIESQNQIERRTLANIKTYFKLEFDLDDVYCISTKMKFRDRLDFLKLEKDMEVVLRRQRGTTTA